MTRPRQILCCRSHWPRQATRRLRADSTAVPLKLSRDADYAVNAPLSNTSGRRRASGPKQVLQSDGDPGWQWQLLHLRDSAVNRIRDFAERHRAA
jgi:hypothetical protein